MMALLAEARWTSVSVIAPDPAWMIRIFTLSEGRSVRLFERASTDPWTSA